MYKRVLVALLALMPWSTQAALPDFQPIVEAAAPAVVKILVESEAQAMPSPDELEELPEYLRRFFEFRGRAPQQQRVQGVTRRPRAACDPSSLRSPPRRLRAVFYIAR